MPSEPMISVITPTYNCAPYIRQCIESVLAQNYPNFEHIIVDGASQDGTVDVLREYPHLRWISEPDEGEGYALNKALAMVRGDIVAWLNADDYYLENAFAMASREIDPAHNRHVIYGDTDMVDDSGHRLWIKNSKPQMNLRFLLRFWEANLFQPSSIFYARAVLDDIGPFDARLHFSMDYEHWLRTILKYEFHHVPQMLSASRQRDEGKSAADWMVQWRSHWRVSRPFHRYRYLGLWGLIMAWAAVMKNYYGRIYWGPIRIKLGLRTRLRGLFNVLRRAQS